MAARVTLTAEEAAFAMGQRVARLATADASGVPHVIPICYAWDGDRFFTPLDEKPKRVGDADLRRVRNIRLTGRVALLVDRYDDDWSRLAYLLVHGSAELLGPGAPSHAEALDLLRGRYVQYQEMALEQRTVIAISPRRVVSWGNMR